LLTDSNQEIKRAKDYKKLILENNAKILKFKQAPTTTSTKVAQPQKKLQSQVAQPQQYF